MGRLTDQGVLYRLQKGGYEDTDPTFRAYVQRNGMLVGDSGTLQAGSALGYRGPLLRGASS